MATSKRGSQSPKRPKDCASPTPQASSQKPKARATKKSKARATKKPKDHASSRSQASLRDKESAGAKMSLASTLRRRKLIKRIRRRVRSLVVGHRVATSLVITVAGLSTLAATMRPTSARAGLGIVHVSQLGFCEALAWVTLFLAATTTVATWARGRRPARNAPSTPQPDAGDGATTAVGAITVRRLALIDILAALSVAVIAAAWGTWDPAGAAATASLAWGVSRLVSHGRARRAGIEVPTSHHWALIVLFWSAPFNAVKNQPLNVHTNRRRSGLERVAYVVLLALAAVTFAPSALSAEMLDGVEHWLEVQTEQDRPAPTPPTPEDAAKCFDSGVEIMTARKDLDLTAAERAEAASATDALMARGGVDGLCFFGLARSDGLVSITVRPLDPDQGTNLFDPEVVILLEVNPKRNVVRQPHILLPDLATRTRLVLAESGPIDHLVLVRDTGGHSFLLIVDAAGRCALVVAVAGPDPDALTYKGDACAATVREVIASKRLVWAAQDSETLVLMDRHGTDSLFSPGAGASELTDLEVAAFRCVAGRYSEATAWFPSPESRSRWPVGVRGLSGC